MRVISGNYRGVPLLEFEGKDIRPTADRTKESLFNILQNKIIGSTFLDLFCGTGSIGIEAISRNAKEVVFVDESKKSIEITKKNLKKLKIETDNTNLSDAISFLQKTQKKFDIIFIDPPYKSDVGEISLSVIEKNNILAENGIAVFERDVPFECNMEKLEVFDERKYGKAYLTFIRYKIK